MEEKVRLWLATIPKSPQSGSHGNRETREWDDEQIAKIAHFAREASIEDLEAEEIYRRYVMYQVEIADQVSVDGYSP